MCAYAPLYATVRRCSPRRSHQLLLARPCRMPCRRVGSDMGTRFFRSRMWIFFLSAARHRRLCRHPSQRRSSRLLARNRRAAGPERQCWLVSSQAARHLVRTSAQTCWWCACSGLDGSVGRPCRLYPLMRVPRPPVMCALTHWRPVPTLSSYPAVDGSCAFRTQAGFAAVLRSGH